MSTDAERRRAPGYGGYSAEELAATAEISRQERPGWRWVLPVTKSTRDYIVAQMPALYIAYGVAIAMIFSAVQIEGAHSPSLLLTWLVESAASIGVRILIQRRMESASPVEIVSRKALRVLPLAGILLAAVHWSWTASLFIGPTLTPTTIVVLMTYMMLSVASVGIAPVSPAICLAYIVPMWTAVAIQLSDAQWATASTLLVIAVALATVLWSTYFILVRPVRRFLVRGDEVEELVGRLRLRNEEVEHLQRVAARDLQTRSAIFASASHDFRQRVHAMKLLTQRADGLSDTRLAGSIEDLELYISELLRFVQLDDTTPLQCETVRLQDVFQRVEVAFEDAATARCVQLHFRATDLQLRTHAASLVRVLENLVSNAIRLTRRRVLVAARRSTRGVLLEVWDQGPGLPVGTLEEFLEARSPARQSMTPGEGFGLGLTIVRRLADALGYDVEMRSEFQRGTCIRIVIPPTALTHEVES